jgi:hypothetical protein
VLTHVKSLTSMYVLLHMLTQIYLLVVKSLTSMYVLLHVLTQIYLLVAKVINKYVCIITCVNTHM